MPFNEVSIRRRIFLGSKPLLRGKQACASLYASSSPANWSLAAASLVLCLLLISCDGENRYSLLSEGACGTVNTPCVFVFGETDQRITIQHHTDNIGFDGETRFISLELRQAGNLLIAEPSGNYTTVMSQRRQDNKPIRVAIAQERDRDTLINQYLRSDTYKLEVQGEMGDYHLIIKFLQDLDKDGLIDVRDSGDYKGTPCRMIPVDCDKDGLIDQEDTGTNVRSGIPCRVLPDCDGDGLRDREDIGINISSATPCRLLPDCDGDGIDDAQDNQEFNGTPCRIIPNDCDNDGLTDIQDNKSFDGTPCKVLVDCDGDGIDDPQDVRDFNGMPCKILADCDEDGIDDGQDLGEHQGILCKVLVDCDGDNQEDSQDVDRDGDGLIELATAEELNNVRWTLNGTGYRDSAEEDIDSIGCPATGCRGYELVADIRLAEDYDTDFGWEPLGNFNAPFTTLFEGNNRTISHLFINRPEKNQVGLFGYVASTVQLRNIHLKEVNISGRGYVGSLVGYTQGATITGSSAMGNVTGADNAVGGLVGSGEEAKIIASYATGVVFGEGDNVGGLVGFGQSARIKASYATGEVTGMGDHTGGLVGDGYGSTIIASYATGRVLGINDVGGLVGDGYGSTITASYATGEISGSNNLGGLVGIAGLITINSQEFSTNITVSYWDSDTSGIPSFPADSSSKSYGVPQTTMALRTSLTASGIYAEWTQQCPNDKDVWDFGTSSQYPAIRCTPGGSAIQRQL